MKIRNPILMKLGAVFIYYLLKLLYATCRVEIILLDKTADPYDFDTEERFLFCVWHDQILTAVTARRCPAFAALVSRHRDGGILNEFFRLHRIKGIRGSSSRGGSQAIRQMMDEAKGQHVAITPDGPRGPRWEVKEGVVFLAAKSGRRIVMGGYGHSSCWSIKGKWTDMKIPRPFSKIVIHGGLPISVPEKVNKQEREHYRMMVQQQLLDMTERAERIARGEKVEDYTSSLQKAA